MTRARAIRMRAAVRLARLGLDAVAIAVRLRMAWQHAADAVRLAQDPMAQGWGAEARIAIPAPVCTGAGTHRAVLNASKRVPKPAIPPSPRDRERALIEQAVQEGRVTRLPPGPHRGWTPSWWE